MSPNLLSNIFSYSKDNYLWVLFNSKVNYANTRIPAKEMFVYDNTIFTLFDDKVSEISIIDNISKPMAVIKSFWHIMKNSSKVFDGFIYQNILGKSYLNIIIPSKTISLSYYDMYSFNWL